MNQDILQKIKNQDYNSISNRIQNGLKQKIEETNAKGVILGLSGGGSGITKDQMERLIEKAAQTAPGQTIRIEQTPVLITTKDSNETYKL